MNTFQELWLLIKRLFLGRASSNIMLLQYTGCLKKNATEIQQTVVHHKLN
jgi:hypothetical protein